MNRYATKLAKKILPTKLFLLLKQVHKTCLRFIHMNNLNNLALVHGTDKWGHHSYTQHYSTYFSKFRNERLSILEIGIGGYDNQANGGHSLRMWKDYFPNSVIYGLDIINKSLLTEKRIRILQGDQTDTVFLKEIIEKNGRMDIIIDDGSHNPFHQIITFKTLFPQLNPGGFYAVEDTVTTYFKSWGGSENINNPDTFLGFAKRLTDCVNSNGISEKLGDLTPYSDIEFVHFFKNLVVIKKAQK